MIDARATPTVDGAEAGELVPLDRLPHGACGRVAHLDVAKLDLQRLEVMGICAGRTVTVVQSGDPMIVRVLDTRIALAAALATFVYVEPAPAPE